VASFLLRNPLAFLAAAPPKKIQGSHTPKRVIDADAAWASSKLALCREEFIPEYTWLYGLADANGNFELTNLRVIHGKVAAIRPNFTLDTLRHVFEEFERHGLLYVWEEHGKKYGHWTGSEKPGLLPPWSQRDHFPQIHGITLPTDRQGKHCPGLQQYIDEHRNGRVAVQQTPLFQPEPLPLPDEVQEDAEDLAEDAAERAEQNDTSEEKAYREAQWLVFWATYPKHADEPQAKKRWMKRVALADIPAVIAGVEQWNASGHWSDPQFVKSPVNFLKSENWRHPPEVKRNGKPDPNTRAERNLRNLGLAGPKVDVHSR
jgi:hypothetical protein